MGLTLEYCCPPFLSPQPLSRAFCWPLVVLQGLEHPGLRSNRPIFQRGWGLKEGLLWPLAHLAFSCLLLCL